MKKGQEIEFVFEQGISQKDFYIENAKLNIQELNGLFPSPPNSIVVNVFQKKKSFLRAVHKRKIPDWFIACVLKNNTSHIYVFNDKEKLTEKQEAIYRQVLLHEITHLYTNKLNPRLPDWLKEGISVYIAAQIFRPSVSSADWKKIAPKDAPFARMSWGRAVEHNGYSIAGLLVMFFVRKYGWKKFIATVRDFNPETNTNENVLALFEESAQLIDAFKKQFVK